MSLRKGDDVIAGGNTTRIDSALNPNSINPVQNKVVASALNTKQNTMVAGDGIVIDPDGVTVNVGGLDCGTMS